MRPGLKVVLALLIVIGTLGLSGMGCGKSSGTSGNVSQEEMEKHYQAVQAEERAHFEQQQAQGQQP